MANNYVISPSATREIEGILVYLSDVLMSSDAALSFLDELDRQLQITCQFPGSHPVCPHPDLAERVYRSSGLKDTLQFILSPTTPLTSSTSSINHKIMRATLFPRGYQLFQA